MSETDSKNEMSREEHVVTETADSTEKTWDFEWMVII